MRKKDKLKLMIRLIQLPCILILVWFVVDVNFVDTMPNVYQALVVFVENINIFNINWGLNKGVPANFN